MAGNMEEILIQGVWDDDSSDDDDGPEGALAVSPETSSLHEASLCSVLVNALPGSL
jgi:hypothetical protein